MNNYFYMQRSYFAYKSNLSKFATGNLVAIQRYLTTYVARQALNVTMTAKCVVFSKFGIKIR